MRILCVDDDDDTCQILTALLSNSGLDAVCVPDVATALRLMSGEQFRLYIIDEQLPDISGLTLCQQIRRQDGHTPVLIFSGHGYEEDREAGMRAGCNAYIVKPAISEIVPTVKRLLAQAPVMEQ
jgi:DNA-binding response OmpR family regulator